MPITPKQFFDLAGDTMAALLDMFVWISGNLLPNVTQLSEACGLKCVAPYLDNRLYDLSLQIPAICKNNGVQNKIVFRKAAENILGKEDTEKRKLGFPVLITAWLKLPESVHRIKSAFSSSAADLVLTSVSKLYPLDFAGKEPYSREKVAELLSKKIPCLVTVPGVHDARHFVVPVAVQGELVKIIDSGWDKPLLSEFSDAFEIYEFR